MKKAKVLIFDIESLPLKARLWDTGKQFIGHKQFLHGFDMWDLICIQYAWNDGKPVKVLRYDKHGGTKGVIEKFDELVKKADVLIGKNSDRFDIKMLNTLRIVHGIPPVTGWEKYSEDLEKQMRRFFRLPSYSLDYISKLCGIGGKNKMEFDDWAKIQDMRSLLEFSEFIKGKQLDLLSKKLYGKSAQEVIREGKIALDKMCTYGAKDTDDTRTLWNYLVNHFEPKHNSAVFHGVKLGCKSCGSENLTKNGTRISGKTRYQRFHCSDCFYTGTRSPISKTDKLGQSG